MIASNRKLSRLPIHVFEILITRPPHEARNDKPDHLKMAICNRLRKFPVKSSHMKQYGRSSTTTTASIKTVGQLLRCTKITLLLALDPILTYEEIGIFLDRVCRQCTPTPISALEIMHKTLDRDVMDQTVKTRSLQQQRGWRNETKAFTSSTNPNISASSFGNQVRCIPTGLSSLDEVLRGGIRTTTVTEVVGKPGMGKTQLAFQLCVMAARYNQGSIYIDTERKMSPSRLREMGLEWRKRSTVCSSHNYEENAQTKGSAFSYNLSATHLSSNSQPLSQSQIQHDSTEDAALANTIGAYKSAEQLLGNLTIYNPKSTAELQERLALLEDEILQRNQIANEQFTDTERQNDDDRIYKYPVRLLIVDSIAAPMRRDFGTDAAPQRAAAIFQCAQTLKRLADQLHLAVVVINQVGSTSTDLFSVGTGSGDGVLSGCDPFSASRAALGTSWHHCVTTRLEMDSSGAIAPNREMEMGVNVPICPQQTIIRRISVRKSGLTPFVTIPFEIATLGIGDYSGGRSQR
ncbi:DNA repair and recombination protein radA [Nitzschia inconspicua]|uniref:DNA repair and recombination protein radA n=1 Tax=Nitzschia inconspicua TaxID=303405 RepID=A0A9K3KN89_9STRA|nr:DNA repair and recombination protein radA [Nitzschia inconspicua]